MSDTPPYRPFDFGPDGHPGVGGFFNTTTLVLDDDDGDGVADNIEEVGWPGSDDRPIPLSAIQIKITFFDPASQQVREVTLVQSMLYTP